MRCRIAARCLKPAGAVLGKRGEKNMAKLTPMRAIRKKCLECCNGQAKEVRLCTIEKCALHEYRSGHRPKGEENIAEED